MGSLTKITGTDRQAALEQIAAIDCEAALEAQDNARRAIAEMRDSLDLVEQQLEAAAAGEPTWEEPMMLYLDVDPLREAFSALRKADGSQRQLGLPEGAQGASVMFRIDEPATCPTCGSSERDRSTGLNPGDLGPTRGANPRGWCSHEFHGEHRSAGGQR